MKYIRQLIDYMFVMKCISVTKHIKDLYLLFGNVGRFTPFADISHLLIKYFSLFYWFDISHFFKITLNLSPGLQYVPAPAFCLCTAPLPAFKAHNKDKINIRRLRKLRYMTRNQINDTFLFQNRVKVKVVGEVSEKWN